MKTPRYTAQQVIAALQATHGMVYLAAQQLRCDPDTVMNYCKRHPSVEQAKQDARGAILDECELRLLKAIRKDQPWAIAFALRTIGKQRGYVERQELAHEGQVELTTSPEWLALRTRLVETLAPYPEARALLAQVLSGDDAAGPEHRNGHVPGP
jgi:hypothetical protein